MCKLISILLLNFVFQLSFGQITTTSIIEKPANSPEPYDSLENFLGEDVFKYIGQDLYLKGKPESLREYGYSDFVIDFGYQGFDRGNNTYKCCDGFNSKYDELAEKYFTVLAVHKHPKAEKSPLLYGKTYYLELKEKESGDVVFFKYSTEFEHNFPFIVVGFFEKLKADLIGQELVFANKTLESSKNIHSGEAIINEINHKWKCVGITVDEKYYNLSILVENAHGETTVISYNSAFGKYSLGRCYISEEAERFENKFGLKNWLLILAGKVEVGFTEEMVLLSWGIPQKINKASYGDQWVYDGQYLYFDNGTLKSFN